MKSIKDARKSQANQNKYIVAVKLNTVDEEKIAIILDKRGITLTHYVNELLRKAIEPL